MLNFVVRSGQEHNSDQGSHAGSTPAAKTSPHRIKDHDGQSPGKKHHNFVRMQSDSMYVERFPTEHVSKSSDHTARSGARRSSRSHSSRTGGTALTGSERRLSLNALNEI